MLSIFRRLMKNTQGATAVELTLITSIIAVAAIASMRSVTGKVTKVDEASGQVTVELTVTCEGRKVLGRALAVVDLAPAGE